jgi:hypothetical protein
MAPSTSERIDCWKTPNQIVGIGGIAVLEGLARSDGTQAPLT